MAEKGLILVRVVMTVIYGHVIHSLRSVTTHRQHASFSEHLTELAARLTEHPALPELARLAETVEMHSRTLTELAALPGQLEQLQQAIHTQVRAVVQQETQAALAAHTEQHRTPRARNFRW
jgi:hypothetical protein